MSARPIGAAVMRAARWACLAAVLLALPLRAGAAAKPPIEAPALLQLQHMVENLGFSTTLDAGAQYFYFVMKGGSTYTVHFALSDDQSYAVVYATMVVVNAAQLAQINQLKLLADGGDDNFFFSLNDDGNGEESVLANAIYPALGLSPVMLNADLLNLVKSMDATQRDWDYLLAAQK